MTTVLSEGYAQNERGPITRIAVFFDARSMPAHSLSAGALDRTVNRLVSEWVRRPEYAEDVARVKRVCAAHHLLPLALTLGRRMGWWQGGNGEEDEIASFIVNDSKALCMEAPGRSAVVLLSDDEGLAEVIAEIREVGSEVYLITQETSLPNNLAAGIEVANIGLLPSTG